MFVKRVAHLEGEDDGGYEVLADVVAEGVGEGDQGQHQRRRRAHDHATHHQRVGSWGFYILSLLHYTSSWVNTVGRRFSFELLSDILLKWIFSLYVSNDFPIFS